MTVTIILILIVTTFMIAQALLTLVWMLYAWNNPEKASSFTSPTEFHTPYLSFTALVPVRFEHAVIKDTIKAIDEIDYPDSLKETLILCRDDDKETIKIIQDTIEQLPATSNISLQIISDGPLNKPHSLNCGLKKASKDIVAIFDAEDQPHKDIYAIINTLFHTQDVDVIQSGIQLINYKSRWFSLLNVLEYFFWFKSGLQFFNSVGNITPLGGNTVFFKRKWLNIINGWKAHHLTEDAEIGIRLIAQGAKCSIVYDEKHTTLEESPLTIQSFIKQRTRWDQGFFQVLLEGEWKKLPTFKQRFFVFYILLSPFIPIVFILNIPISLILLMTIKLPLIISLYSFIPLYLFLFQMLVYILGFWEFAKAYSFRIHIVEIFIIPLTFYFYQILLTISAIRAVTRIIHHNTKWEKTTHTNIHRKNTRTSYASI